MGDRRLCGRSPAGCKSRTKVPYDAFLTIFLHKSSRPVWVLWAFLGSCTALLILSWVTVFVPNLTPTANLRPGVPVKNYIDQSQSFALCAVVLAWPILELIKARKLHLALPLLALSIAFLADLSFVVVARTALIEPAPQI